LVNDAIVSATTMSFVRTVLGDLPASQLGVCYAHEHVVIDSSFATERTPDFLLADVDRATEELRALHRAGVRSVIDAMPCDAGRNVTKLARVALASGVHVVAPTGLHLAKYYDPKHWGNFYTDEQLAALFIEDIESGIDAHDYNGPIVARTTHRAGVIKLATGSQITTREERVMAAAAAAHRQTGAPILTHTDEGALGLEQVERLRSLGVDLTHVCLSHLDRKPDLAYHREILASGVRVEYDSAFRWKAGQGNPTLDLIIALLPEFPQQIMLGMDAARRRYWRSYGGEPGLTYLITEFSAQLRAAGVTEAQLHAIFVTAPALTFAFAKPVGP
jgi:phosphotriesterase-related protein